MQRRAERKENSSPCTKSHEKDHSTKQINHCDQTCGVDQRNPQDEGMKGQGVDRICGNKLFSSELEHPATAFITVILGHINDE